MNLCHLLSTHQIAATSAISTYVVLKVRVLYCMVYAIELLVRCVLYGCDNRVL